MSTNPSVRTASLPFGRTSRLALSIPESTLVLFACFLSLYLLFLPDVAYQPWDSLDYSYSTEVIGVITMRGNHPLGHIIHSLAFMLANTLGYAGRALFIAQIVNGIAGSLSVALFFWMLAHQLRVKTLIAVGGSILLGVSHGFWFYTGTADIYVISVLCILLTWASLIHEVTLRNRPLPVASGIFAGVSIIAHQLNILLIPAGMFLILLTSGRLVALERKIKQLVAFLFYAILVFIAGYIFLGFIATSSTSLAWIIGWARGHFGDPTYGRYLSAEYFLTAFDTASQTIVTALQDGNSLLRYVLFSILVFITFLGLLFHKALDDTRRPVWMIATLQTLITWTLILWWEPQNMKFWILALVPWMLSLALSVQAVDSHLRDARRRLPPSLTLVSQAFPALIGLTILAANFPVISGQHNPQNDRTIAFHRALDLWTQHSDPDSVLITASDLVPHLLYWSNRPGTVILYRSLQLSQPYPDDFYELHTRIARAQCEHRSVLFTPEAVETISDNELLLVDITREDLQSIFDELTEKGEIVFWYEDIFSGRRVPVYELTGTVNCVD